MNVERLSKLSEHLKKGAIEARDNSIFDFSVLLNNIDNSNLIDKFNTKISLEGYHDTVSNGIIVEPEEFLTWHCGTVGCAMGELPFLFPDEFSIRINKKSDVYGNTYLCNTICNKRGEVAEYKIIAEFFDFDERFVELLFYPSQSDQREFFDFPHAYIEKAVEVAENIDFLIEHPNIDFDDWNDDWNDDWEDENCNNNDEEETSNN